MIKRAIAGALLVSMILTGCSAANKNKLLDKSKCSQPGSYFVENENRFILVDESYQDIGGETYLCKVFADKYMLTMYLYTERGNGGYYEGFGSITQIFYEDGSPMIYDPTEEEWAEWEK